MDLLIIIPAFLVTIGILVTIHEFGHYWVARKLGVKVLRFSVGMGKPFWSKRAGPDQTEYALAPFPIGGYVHLLGQQDGDEIKPEDQHRAFNNQPIWKRFAIVAAGPIANFILAALLYAVMYGIGVPAMQPLVTTYPNTPAVQAGFQTGDRITKIGATDIISFQDARSALLEYYLINTTVPIEVKTQTGQMATRQLDLSSVTMLKDEEDYFPKAGLRPWAPNMQVAIGKVMDDTPAAAAGLKANDKIVEINGLKPDNVDTFVNTVRNSQGQPLQLKVERGSDVISLTVTPQLKEIDGKKVQALGIALAEYIPPEVAKSLTFTQRYGFFDAIGRGLEETRQMTVMSFKLMGRLVTGEVSLSNISGPVTIAKFSGEAAKSGLISFIGFLAIISVSLGLLNLLPIPLLDGGHLMFYIIEAIKGSPVSKRVEEFGMRIGLTAIGSLMVLAFYNDLMRLIR